MHVLSPSHLHVRNLLVFLAFSPLPSLAIHTPIRSYLSYIPSRKLAGKATVIYASWWCMHTSIVHVIGPDGSSRLGRASSQAKRITNEQGQVKYACPLSHAVMAKLHLTEKAVY